MCYKVECKRCGKTSWGGCGKHLTTLYPTIEEGKHCMCRSWPGVVIPSETPPAASTSTTTGTYVRVGAKPEILCKTAQAAGIFK